MPLQAARQGRLVHVRVPAKINLFLAVRGRRGDGFHELLSVMQTVSLFDHLKVRLSGAFGECVHPATRRQMHLAFEVADAPRVPTGEANLAVRAAMEFGRRVGIREVLAVAGAPGFAGHAAPGEAQTEMCLHKDIPLAGGMAGGSADAAATLVALNQLWDSGLTRHDLREIAAALGSDVPFCVSGGTALATGRGVATAQVLCRGTFHWVVCASKTPLPTAEVYRHWDRCCVPTEVEPDAVLAALRGRDAVALGAALHNELEPATFTARPELRDHKAALLGAGALGAVVSGSGPTLLALAPDPAGAEAIAQAVAGRFERVAVVRSPAGGPEFLAG